MDTMRVYRIEDSRGVGPYNSDITSETVERMRLAHQAFSHPAWLLDFNRWPNDGERCAFESMTQMFSWFGGYLPIMLGMGYSVRIYEVPVWHVQRGLSGKQLMFQSTKARRLDRNR